MQNKVYFTETKPGVFEKNPKFKLKTKFVANIECKETEAFGWKTRHRISDEIESMKKTQLKKTCRIKEKQP